MAGRSMPGHGIQEATTDQHKPQQVSRTVNVHLLGTKMHHLYVINPEVFYDFLFMFIDVAEYKWGE